MTSSKIVKIFLGLPLSGKSTLINDPEYKEGFAVVSADTYKENHEDYNPNHAYLLHEWSVDRAEEEMNKLSDSGVNIIMDGGGINNSYTLRIIEMLREKGYKIVLVHMRTPLEVCLKRNTKRERKVPFEDIIQKAAREITQFHTLTEVVDEVEIIEHFTNKHIFVDMDGVIAALTTLPKIDGKIDFVNSEVFKHLKPVIPIMEKLLELEDEGATLYILSATPNSFSSHEKNAWLDKHFPIATNKRHFVNSGRYKAEMLDNLTIKLKLDKRDVSLVDDTHDTLYRVKALCMKPIHPSELLTM